MNLVEDTRTALARVTAALPDGGEDRPGQRDMAQAVAETIESETHLVVQAGTGTGKSLAYLVPALLSGRRVVVATATKALQDQLADKDLPFLEPVLGRPFTFAVLKGRSNYVCRQRLAELDRDEDQLALDGVADRTDADELNALREWALESATGDQAELDFQPSPRTWDAVSVGPRECPGRARCPAGGSCFAEQARDRAGSADLVVVNLHLYGLDIAADGAILGDHDVVIIDEAHQAEDILSVAAGFDVAPSRFNALARTVRAVLDDDDDLGRVQDVGEDLGDVLRRHRSERVDPTVDELATVLDLARGRVERLGNALRGVPDDVSEDIKARKARASQAVGALQEDIDACLNPVEHDVAWVEGSDANPVLRVAPIEIGPRLAESVWSQRSAVLTSATLPGAVTARLGLDLEQTRVEDVGSPFDYESQALLYCATHLPDPRDDDYREQVNGELEQLIVAAGGRTLALFTSWRALDSAVDHLRDRLPWTVLHQQDLPKPALIRAFTEDEESSLFATMGFWQGIDVPGAALSLVTIDRVPFPRPDDPVLSARRDLAGRDAFRLVDLPRAATMMAQGAGRLIRGSGDRGVVAVLDRRLATSRSYRWELINALPPMRRTRDRDEVIAFLRALRDDPPDSEQRAAAQ